MAALFQSFEKESLMRSMILLMVVPLLWLTLLWLIDKRVPVPSNVQELNRAEWTRLDMQLQPAEKPKLVQLPYGWSGESLWSTQTGRGLGRYHLEIDMSGENFPTFSRGMTLALLLPRVGNGYRVTLNGRVLEQAGFPHANGLDFSEFPQLILVPDDLWRKDRNFLDIDISANPVAGAGLSPVLLGTFEDLNAEYKKRYRFSQVLLWSIIVLCLIGSFITVFFWRSDPQPLYLWFAAGCAIWALRLIMIGLAHLDDAGSILRANLRDSLYIVFICVMVRFSCMAVGLQQRWIRISLHVTLGFALSFWLLTWAFDWLVMRYVLRGISLLVAMIGTVLVLGRCFMHPNLNNLMIGGIGIMGIMTGARDYLLITLLQRNVSNFSITRVVMFLFLAGMMALLLYRYMQTLNIRRRLTQTLELRVERRRLELEAAHFKLASMRERTVISAERSRLMREMHDGLGHYLVQAMQLVQGASLEDPLRTPMMTRMLRAMVELRLSIDVLSSEAVDVMTSLGNFRQRVEPLLSRAGIRIEWEFDWLSQPLWMDASAQTHLYRVLQTLVLDAIAARSVTRLVFRGYAEHDKRTMYLSILDDRGHEGARQLCQTPDAEQRKMLSRIRERIAMLRGGVQWSVGSEGWIITMNFMLPEPESDTAAKTDDANWPVTTV